MYTPIPLGDATLSEVLARVAFRVIQRDFHRYGWFDFTTRDALYHLACELHRDGFAALSCWVAAANYQLDHQGFRLADWREDIVCRARRAAYNRRIGKPWRRQP